MKLFEHLTDNLDYSDCESLIDVASLANEAIELTGIETADVLDKLADELGIKGMGPLFRKFEELEDAEIFTTALSDALEHEEKAAKYPWDVADVVVGIMLLHGKQELREQLSELPYRKD